MKKIVLFSGGLDSTVLLASCVNKFGKDNVIALNIFYGQKHKKEQEYAEWQADYYGVELINLDVSNLFAYNKDFSSLIEGSDKKVSEGSYSEQIKSNNINTYVPFRNGLFLSIAATIALQVGAYQIYSGIHRDDMVGNAYPDCSFSFINAMTAGIHVGTGNKVNLINQFINMNKSNIVGLGKNLKVNFNKTWSCYQGEEEPCKACATCLDRKTALVNNGIINID